MIVENDQIAPKLYDYLKAVLFSQNLLKEQKQTNQIWTN